MDKDLQQTAVEVAQKPPRQSITLQIDPEEFKRRFKEALRGGYCAQQDYPPPEAWDPGGRNDRIAKLQEEISQIFSERHQAKSCAMQKLATRRKVLQSRLNAKRIARRYLKRQAIQALPQG